MRTRLADLWTAPKKKPLGFDYRPIKHAVAHFNGHTIEIDWTPDAKTHNNSIAIGGTQYNLIQFHFHTPSEHRMADMQQAPATAVATPAKRASASASPASTGSCRAEAVDTICAGNPPADEEANHVDLPLNQDPVRLAPRWEHPGSLTTPPYMEKVAWNVMHASFPIGINQLKALVELEGSNVRKTNEDLASKRASGALPPPIAVP
ncbi:hypothetical protein BGX29_010226 [Mortierella sp. GBA35]|nr:hypothetical protein BGX29_010226 [Mortierella sp. GBA35]